MKKRLIIIFVCCAALLVGTLVFVQFKNDSKSVAASNASNSEIIGSTPLPKILNGESKYAEAMYLDNCETLKELKENSELIIEGEVEKQEDFGLASILSTVKVKKAYKGENFEEIEVLQLKDGSALDLEKEYVLFLGKQTDDSGKFFIKGGFQGKFTKTGEKIENTDTVMQKELEKLKKNYKSTSGDFSRLESFLGEN